MSIKEILVIGSGLSSAAFCDGYLEKNNNIEIISPFNVGHNEIKNTNIKKTLPIHINNKNIQYVNFFNEFLNLKQNDKVNIFGSLNKYGNSSYWGFGLDNYNKAELNFTNKKDSEILIDCMNKIYNKFNVDQNEIFLDNEKNQDFFDKLFFVKDKNINIGKSLLGIDKSILSNKYRYNLTDYTNSKLTINANNYFNKIGKNKNIKFHNLVVQNISKNDELYQLNCIDCKNKKKVLKAKKIVLACGTLISTKLISDFLDYKEPIRIYHHPMIFSSFISKSNINDNFILSRAFLENKNFDFNYKTNFRNSSDEIVNKIYSIYNKYLIFKFQFNIIQKLSKYLIFSNTYLEAKKSNLYFQNFKDKIEIYSTNQDIIVKDLYKASYDLYKILKKNKLIFPVYKNFFPGIGSDVHYFNTIPNSSNKILGVNRIGKLNNENGIFIVDGSVINSHSYKFPTGLIMANANRIGSEI